MSSARLIKGPSAPTMRTTGDAPELATAVTMSCMSESPTFPSTVQLNLSDKRGSCGSDEEDAPCSQSIMTAFDPVSWKVGEVLEFTHIYARMCDDLSSPAGL